MAYFLDKPPSGMRSGEVVTVCQHDDRNYPGGLYTRDVAPGLQNLSLDHSLRSNDEARPKLVSIGSSCSEGTSYFKTFTHVCVCVCARARACVCGCVRVLTLRSPLHRCAYEQTRHLSGTLKRSLFATTA